MRGFVQDDGIGQVRTGGDDDADHLRRERVGDVIAVEIERGDHVEFLGVEQYLLQKGVGDAVFDDDLRAGLGVGVATSWAFVDLGRAELLLRHLVTPTLEGTLGEFHDVALVDQGHRFPIIVDGVLYGLAYQPLRPFPRLRLDADARGRWETNLLYTHLFLQEHKALFRHGRLRGPFDAGINVLGILAEDHQDHQNQNQNEARRTRVVAHGPQTEIE